MAVPAAPPPPDEAAEYFRAKQLRPAFDYRDVWRQEHRTGFTLETAVGRESGAVGGTK